MSRTLTSLQLIVVTIAGVYALDSIRDTYGHTWEIVGCWVGAVVLNVIFALMDIADAITKEKNKTS